MQPRINQMLLKTTNWLSVAQQISKATGRPMLDIYHSVGIGGSVIPPAEPRHSEGEALLELFRHHVGGGIPTITKDENTRCPCCMKKIKRIDLIRIKVGAFKCLNCLKKVKKSKKKGNN